LGNEAKDEYDDVSSFLGKDKIIARVTTDNGLIHFARASEGTYDPICFDSKKRKGRECEIVRLDHEEILLHEKIKVVEDVAPSLKEFMEIRIKNR